MKKTTTKKTRVRPVTQAEATRLLEVYRGQERAAEGAAAQRCRREADVGRLRAVCARLELLDALLTNQKEVTLSGKAARSLADVLSDLYSEINGVAERCEAAAQAGAR
jgi:hypothetical protein